MRQQPPPETYGLHLTLRLGSFHDPATLDDTDLVSRFLLTLVRNIGMRVLAGPLVAREQGPPTTSGCSGVVILYESHVAIHTYPHRAAAFVDVFSCRQFAIERVADTVAAHFGAHQVVEQHLAERGFHWADDAGRALLAWRAER